MWNALFAFGDAARADVAARTLADAGVPESALRVHRRGSGPRGGAVEQADEQATGGLLTNLYNLFQGVFDWGALPHDAAAYEAVVNRGGAVLELRVDEDERDAIDAHLGALADQRTDWREVR